MCRSWLLVPVLMMAAATALPAQSSRSVFARGYARQLDSLVAAANAAGARLKAYDDSVGRARRALDSLVVPPFRILVERSLREMAAAAARMAAVELKREAGESVAQIAKYQFVVRSERSRTGDADPIVVSILIDGHEVSDLWGVADTMLVSTWLRENALRALHHEMDPALREWMPAQVRFDTVQTSTWTRHRVDLVSSETAVARRCFDGDLRACAITLGLTPVTDRAHEWFDAFTRRAVVERHQWNARQTSEEATRRCLEGDDEGCVLVIRRGGVIVSTVPPSHRAALAQLAVQLGGPGAIDRLLRTPGSPSQRLEAAAGIPTDSLLAQWHRRIRDSRMPSDAVSFRIAGMSLAWVLMFGALALRSSRWR
jgi:hypothetical protein